MRKPVPRIFPFNNHDQNKHVLYPMPLPHGPRAIVRTDGLTTVAWLTDSKETVTEITGFVPHIEQAIEQVYDRMMTEPQPGITVNGQLKYRPGIVFDIVLHDRQSHGAATVTEAALDEFLFDETQPAAADDVCALILAAVPLASFNSGKDDADLWMRRSHVMRGCFRLGMSNVYQNPRPVVRAVTIAPDSWASPDSGCAGRTGNAFWRQVENCFKYGYAGCLIMDVMEPWNINGKHYQLITEDDYL